MESCPVDSQNLPSEPYTLPPLFKDAVLSACHFPDLLPFLDPCNCGILVCNPCGLATGLHMFPPRYDWKEQLTVTDVRQPGKEPNDAKWEANGYCSMG